MMHKFRYFFLIVSTLFSLSAAWGTTVVPPTFDQLTYVTFKVEDRFKGNVGATYSIRLLGGTVDGETMVVTDTPKFSVGDRDILFVENNGSQFVPLVGISHGRFRVQREQTTGRDVLMTNERAPLSDVSHLGKNQRAATAGGPLSVDEFKGAIRARLANP
jgi:hypothetical protein